MQISGTLVFKNKSLGLLLQSSEVTHRLGKAGRLKETMMQTKQILKNVAQKVHIIMLGAECSRKKMKIYLLERYC